MKWMENIRLRVAVDQMKRVRPQLVLLLDGLGQVPGLEKITTYVGVSYPGDMGLTLLWDTDEVPPPMGSPMTQNLVPACKKFGLVDHTVWIEAGRDGPDPNLIDPTHPKGDRNL
jgi:hypothetical protein